MTDEAGRWGRVKQVFQDALDRTPDERSGFLREACGDDRDLRGEVDSLLLAHEAAGSFAQRPAIDALAGSPAVAVHSPARVDRPLQPGDRLGPYEIVDRLGAGGMGDVYRARDSRLPRDVAIKVLPTFWLADPERRARFDREARVLATLNHPHIGALYGVEDADGVRALVMELVEGEDLAQRLVRGPIRLNEALPIAKQIAEALEAAHEQGVIHRDLKPANIKLRPDGTVKVLDFGLAKLAEAPAAFGAVGLSQSPMITTPTMMTGVGMILGTAAYMAPEQAQGKAVDKRADIWAFGCVVFEMRAGRRAFAGDDVADTLAAVLTKEPEWTALPPNTPAAIRRLLRRCLEKDRRRRLADIADARLEIEEALLAPSADSPAVNAQNTAAAPARGRSMLPWVVMGGFAAALALVLVSWRPWRVIRAPVPLRLSADLVAGMSVQIPEGASVVLSPDGALLAFVAQKADGGTRQLFVRHLEQLRAIPLSGTDGASHPFFSPDGQWIAFFTPGKLSKISSNGGAVVTLCNAPNGRGGTWAEDGTIVFSPANGAGVSLLRVSSAGGTPQSFTTLDRGEATQRWPQVLPGGKAVLYTSHSTVGDYENANLVVQPLPTGARKVVQRGGYYGRYLPSGHLVYVHDGTLFAVPFDLGRLERTGPPVPALDGVAANPTAGLAEFAGSDSGAFVYVPSGNDDSPIDWVDHTGKQSPLRATRANWSNPQFSPDGRQLALDIFDGKQWDVWVDDWARDTLSRLTVDPAHDVKPVWTPDGGRIVFASMRDGNTAYNLYWQRADGSGDVQRLTNGKNAQFPGSWHPSGKVLAFEEQNPTYYSLMLLPMGGDEAFGWKPGKPTIFLAGAFDERKPAFSPDGRWLAYQSNESGQYEVYVRPFPARDGKVRISTGSGVFPTWSRTRRELFYGTSDQRIMMVEYTVDGDAFHAEKPRLWSEARYKTRVGPFIPRSFDLHPDGDRFALAAIREAEPVLKQDRVVLISNFFDVLSRIAPTQAR
jgi:serine/threonine protein kinase/Tol biopolymer transport system component